MSNPPNLPIVFVANSAYAKQVCVMMTSILKNNPHSKIDFYILSSCFADECKEMVEKLRSGFDNWTVNYICVDGSLFKDLKLSMAHVSVETYYKYMIADLLPHLSKALYLDADMICRGSLMPLFETDLGDYYCAGVKDRSCDKRHKHRVGHAKDELYVNAGVLLLNLDKLRAERMSRTLIENTKKYADTILYVDQDGMNITFKNKIKELPTKYNFTSSNMRHDYFCINRLSAVILHYTTERKPWTKLKCRMRGEWKKYEKMFEELCSH